MIDIMNQIAAAWWQWMGAMFWQVSLLILVITAIDMAIRRWAWPQVRYALWLLVLLKLMIPPNWQMRTSIVSRIQPGVERHILTRIEKPAQDLQPSGFAQPLPMDLTSISQTPLQLPDPETDVRSEAEAKDVQSAVMKPNWKTLALFAWIGGMVSFIGMLLLKMARLRKWHQMQDDRAIPRWFHELLIRTAQRLNLNKIPAIVFAKDAVTPAVYGMFRPVLLLPHGYFNRLSREEAEHVLLHELCHLKRGDLWLHGFCLILQIAYWFNPLLIWTRRQMKHVREICCDLSVANILREETKGYRDTLLNTARDLLTESVEPGLGLLGVFEEPFRLVTRLRWLEKKTWENRKQVLLASILSSLVVMACFMPMAGVRQAAVVDPSVKKGAESQSTDVTITRLSGDNYVVKQKEPDIEQPIQMSDIQIKKTRSFSAVILQKAGDSDALFESAVEELKSIMKQQRIKGRGHPFLRMFTHPEKVEKHRLAWEVGMPVKENTEVRPPLQLIHVPSRQVASTAVQGLSSTRKSWDRFVEQLESRDYVPCFPPAMEVYNDPPKNKPFWWNTELQLQVIRKGENYPGIKIAIKEIGDGRNILLPMQGSYAQYPDALDKLMQYIRENNIPTKNRMFGVHYSDPQETLPDEYEWEVGCELQPDTELSVEEPFYIRDTITGKYVSCVMDESPNREFPWAAFITQTIFKGYMPVGPAIESWEENPYKKNDMPGRTEMLMPVVKMDNFAEGLAEWGESFGKLIGNLAEQSSEANVEPVQDSWSDKFTQFFSDMNNKSKPTSRFHVQTVPERWMLTHPAKGSLEQMPILFDKLDSYMKANEIMKIGSPFINKFNSEEIVGNLNLIWEAGFEIQDSIAVKAPFKVARLPGCEIMHFHFTQSTDQKAWNRQLSAWLYHHNYRVKLPHIIHFPEGVPVHDRPVNRFEVELIVEELDEPYPEVNVFTRSVSGRHELLLPMKGHFKQENGPIQKLRHYIEKNRIETLDDVFVRYKGNEEMLPEDEIEWEVGIPIRDEIYVKAPFRVEWQNGALLACTTYQGNHLDIPKPFWISYAANFTMNGYLANGMPQKVLREKLDDKDWKVELQWPVRQ